MSWRLARLSARTLTQSATARAKQLSLLRGNAMCDLQQHATATRTGCEGLFLMPKTGESPLSFWHDVAIQPAVDAPTFTFISEIPKNTKAKMEISKELPFNPIVQDRTKNGNLRFYGHNILWNYGCIPQTLEDPDEMDTLTGQLGDGDPIDVVEIGHTPLPTGEIRQVRVLGALALIDQGETDWKVIAIDVTDPRAASIASVVDIPDEVNAIRAWFKNYKVSEGKPENTFGLDGNPTLPQQTIDIINTSHKSWQKLLKAK